MDFDNLWKENRNKFDFTKDLAKAMYEAGQQSKQAEIDELKSKVNDALEAFNDGSFNYCQKQLEELLK